MTLFRNASSLKLIVSDNGKLCTSCCFPFASDDCCCFLNPDTLDWDTITTFALGQLCEDGSNTYESLQDGNLNHLTSDSDWWIQVSDTQNCGNTGWNSVSPFGGPGKTPLFYKVVVTNCMPADITAKQYVRPNGTYILQQEGNSPCNWSGNDGNYWSTTEHSDCLGLRIKLIAINSTIGGPYTIIILYMWGPYWNSQTLILAVTDPCTISGELVDDGTLNWPLNSKLYKNGTNGATATITPIGETIRLWVLGRLYSVDHIGKNQYGNYFICILGHTSTEDDEPGIGVNWPTYWLELGSVSTLIFGGSLVWDIEPFTKCEFSDSLQMTLVVPDDVVGYEGEAWEYKFLICDDDYVTTYDSEWQSSPSFTATGLPECNPDGSGSAKYAWITARARLKNFPLVVACNAPRKIVIMAGGAYIYSDSFFFQGFQDGNIDCGHIHFDNFNFTQFWDPPHPTQPGGQIKIRGRVGFDHWQYGPPTNPTIWGSWYESDWLNENESWETPEDCAGDPDYRFTRLEIEIKLRNACEEGTDEWIVWF